MNQMPKRYLINKNFLVSLMTLIPLLSAVLLGSKEYTVWGQILYLWDVQADPFIQLSEVTPHSLRYALMYPFLIFSEYFKISHDRVFSLVVVFICYMTGRKILATIQEIDPSFRKNSTTTIFVMIMTVSIFFMMNGRITLAFLGYSILLLTVVRAHYRRTFSLRAFILILVSIFLCGVSSGTLFSCIGTLIIAILFEIRRSLKRLKLDKISLIMLIMGITSGYLFFSFVLVGVVKNLTYYGGGYIGFLLMLEHGFGRVFYPIISSISLQGLILFIIIFIISGSYVLSIFRYSFLLHILAGTVAFGAFGFSTLTLAYVPLTVLLALGSGFITNR